MSNLPVKETAFLNTIEMGLGAWSWGDRVLWNFGHDYTEKDAEEAFQKSLASGINFIDTAEVYGSGRSEHFLGDFIKNTDKPVLVATKFFAFPWRLGKGSLTKALQHSLGRLGLEHVDLYQIHWPPMLGSLEFWADALAGAVKSGLARTVGVSNFDKNQTQRVYSILSRQGIPLASNQVEYHLLDRKIEKNGLLARCQELGVRVIAYSPMAKGILTGKYSSEKPPPGLRRTEFGWALGKMQPLLTLMSEIGKEHGGKTPGQVALNWTICKGTLPIPGAKTAAQAEQNSGAVGWKLTSEQVKALDDASDKITR